LQIDEDSDDESDSDSDDDDAPPGQQAGAAGKTQAQLLAPDSRQASVARSVGGKGASAAQGGGMPRLAAMDSELSEGEGGDFGAGGGGSGAVVVQTTLAKVPAKDKPSYRKVALFTAPIAVWFVAVIAIYAVSISQINNMQAPMAALNMAMHVIYRLGIRATRAGD
jgi:hypothetical protein